MTDSQLTRFNKKTVIQENGCLLWTGKPWNGYGALRCGNRTLRAHRLSFEHYVGPIPGGMELDHLCRNTMCVNPSHLEAVTHKENVLRGNWLGAQNARKTACPSGHPYEVSSRRGDGTTFRQCGVCRRKYKREWMRRKRKAERAPLTQEERAQLEG